MTSSVEAGSLVADSVLLRESEASLAQTPPVQAVRWGECRPDALSRTLLALTRHTPLGRGRMRWIIRDALMARHPGPLDCTLYGQPMRAYLADNRCEWKAVLNPSQFDPHERRHIAQAIDKPGAIMLDIGANVGIHSLSAASHARPDARIIAFEPHPETFRRLAYNLALSAFPGFTAFAFALGAEESVLTMSGEDLSLSTLALPGAGPSVRVRPLISCLAELGIEHIDVMKIDVEGYEPEVLRPFLAAAPDALIPTLVIIEALAQEGWDYDCIAALRQRGLEVVARHGNNAIMKMPSRAAG